MNRPENEEARSVYDESSIWPVVFQELIATTATNNALRKRNLSFGLPKVPAKHEKQKKKDIMSRCLNYPDYVFELSIIKSRLTSSNLKEICAMWCCEKYTAFFKVMYEAFFLVVLLFLAFYAIEMSFCMVINYTRNCMMHPI